MTSTNKNKLKVFSTINKDYLPGEFDVATSEEIEQGISKAVSAFDIYKNITPEQRAVFLETIAAEIAAIGDTLIETARKESGLPEGRLKGERDRTTNQLKLFATLLREGSWVEAVIDAALPDRKPLPRADLRKMLLPLGPVVVFGASNFPFAFSTAGGDTASALASGCPVIVKAHSSHLGTNALVARAVTEAVQKCNLPEGVFTSFVGGGAELGQTLAKNPAVKAIGFTGSFRAGMALYKTSVNERETPIPVYAEMSSINPVLVLPEKMEEDVDKAAAMLAASITLGVGQFCTNPGLLFLINSESSQKLINKLSELLAVSPEAAMLNENICKSYYASLGKLMQAQGVRSLVKGQDASASYSGTASLLEVDGADFIANAELQEEVFGPSSLVVRCNTKEELLQCLKAMHGQLTGTVLGSSNDIRDYKEAVDSLTAKVGRLLFNGVPTGVEVSYAMVHGGPFPATTDARTTSVGTDAIKRFVRPICFQDCPEEFLPEALKSSNPLNIMRRVNGTFTSDAV